MANRLGPAAGCPRGKSCRFDNGGFNHVFSATLVFFARRPVKGSKIGLAGDREKTMLASIDMKSDGLPLPTPDATGDELFRLGLLYSTGQGGAPLDYVSAHMLFNLAAMRGSIEAKVYRKEIAEEMASDEVAEAQRQARRWLAQG